MHQIPTSEKPESSLVRIARFILTQGTTSKSEVASSLNLSMPTTLQCIKELIDRGLVHEVGEYKSTGGRKAKSISFVEDILYSIGIEVTANHITIVLINMKSEILASKRMRLVFRDTEYYYLSVQKRLSKFILSTQIPESKILGVGISIPGIVIQEDNLLVISHVLHITNLDLTKFSRCIPYPVYFDNDANCAAYGERNYLNENTIYLSLSNSVGGSIYLNGKVYVGDNKRSGEFGHMIIQPKGKKCYCGKHGCMDAYCSARLLANYTDGNLKKFFQIVDTDETARELFNNYLEYLAIAVTNIHLIFDCNIMLGGYVGSYMKPYLQDLWELMQPHLLFDEDTSIFLLPCHYNQEAASIGVAMYFINKYISQI